MSREIDRNSCICDTRCADGDSKVAAEATLDLGTYCPSGSTSCSSECKAVVDRLSGLSCIGDVSASLGTSYSSAEELCCGDVVNPCPTSAPTDQSGLSQDAVIGIAVGASLGGVLAFVLVVVSVFCCLKKRANKGKTLSSRTRGRASPSCFEPLNWKNRS